MVKYIPHWLKSNDGMNWRESDDMSELLKYPQEYRDAILNKSVKVKPYSLADRLVMIGFGPPFFGGVVSYLVSYLYNFPPDGQGLEHWRLITMCVGIFAMSLSIFTGDVARNYGRQLEKRAAEKGIIYKQTKLFK